MFCKIKRYKYKSEIIIGLLIAIISGYFRDLREGQIGFFLGRLVITPIFLIAFKKFSEEQIKKTSKEQGQHKDE